MKRYEVQPSKEQGENWVVWDTSKHATSVGAFCSRSHADRFCAMLNEDSAFENWLRIEHPGVHLLAFQMDIVRALEYPGRIFLAGGRASGRTYVLELFAEYTSR